MKKIVEQLDKLQEAVLPILNGQSDLEGKGIILRMEFDNIVRQFTEA